MASNEFLFIVTLFLPSIAAIIPLILRRYASLCHNIIMFIIAGEIIALNKILYLFNQGINLQLKLMHIYTGINCVFKPDSYGLILSLMANLLWLITHIYTLGYFKTERVTTKIIHNPSFYFFIAITMQFTTLAAFASNLFILFIAYEMVTLVTYPLIVSSQTEEARIAGKKYLSYLLGSSMMFFLPAIIITYIIAGSLDFNANGILKGKLSNEWGITLLFLYILGIGKYAIIPLHSWLPTAMVAPAPVSALLHAVAVVKIGIFTLIKIVNNIFGLQYIESLSNSINFNPLAIVAVITIILASFIAMRQKELKKILAYSTISQLSYCLLAISLYSHKAVAIAALLMVAHAFAKITLFFAAGDIYISQGVTRIEQMNGLAKKLPINTACFTVASLSIIGFPLSLGFISKFYLLIEASLHKGAITVFIVLGLSTILTSSYLLPIIYRFYFCDADQKNKNLSVKINLPMTISMLTTCTLMIIISGFYKNILSLALRG